MEHEYKTFAEFKTIESDLGGFEGYASLFSIRDSGGDIVQPGAFKNTLDTFLRDGFIADGHNWDSVADGAIGTIADAHEDERGLFIRTEYHSTVRAQAARSIALERMERGKSVGLSIGYSVRPGGSDFDESGTRHLLDLNLFEVSQVNVPMLRPAGLTSAKSAGLSFSDHAERVAVFLKELIERADVRAAIRAKDGRELSEANRRDLATVIAAYDEMGMPISGMKELLRRTERPAKSADDRDALSEQPDPPKEAPDLNREYAAFLAFEASRNGVAVGV